MRSPGDTTGETEALRRADERYRSLLLAISDIVWTAGASGEMVEPQIGWQDYTGQTWEQAKGFGWVEAIHPDDRSAVTGDWLNAVAAQAVYRAQGLIWCRQAGAYHVFQSCGVPVVGPDGAIEEWVGSLTDVQETLEAQRRLREVEAQSAHQLAELEQAYALRDKAAELEAVLNAVPGAIFIADDPGCRTMRGNEACRELLLLPPGIDPAKSLPAGEAPTHFRVLKDGVEVAPAEQPMQRAAATGQRLRNVELELVFEEGSKKSIYGNATPLFAPSGATRGAVGAFIDVTELVEARRAARESEAHCRWALMAGRLVHWDTDLVAGTRTWNDEAMALFGLTLAGGRGRFGGEADEFRLAVHPDDRHLVEEFYEQAERQDWFPVEYRILKSDGTVRWVSGGGQVVARDGAGKPRRLVNVVTDITDRKAAEEHVKFLMRELTHRSKNLLAVIQAIADQTGRTAGTADEFQIRFMQRLRALAASHDLLVQQNWQGVALADLVRNQLAPFAGIKGPRLNVSGPDILLSPKAAEALGLALNELATNAVKYGALSVPAGHVSISWSLQERAVAPPDLRLRWVERGGPVVKPPARKGFGHAVFERSVAISLDGGVAIDFAPEGLNWELTIPATNLVAENEMNRNWPAP